MAKKGFVRFAAILLVVAVTLMAHPVGAAGAAADERRRPGREEEALKAIYEERLKREEALREENAAAAKLIVKWRKGVGKEERRAAILGAGGGLLSVRAEEGDFALIEVPREKIKEVKSALERDPGVQMVEEPVPRRLLGAPNDPLFSQQWGLKKIRAADAWDILDGRKPAKVAVIDSGVDYYHEDLLPNLDLENGWDFILNDGSPLDLDGHGTHVAGIIAAATGNGTGVAGATGNEGVKIIPMRVVWYTGEVDPWAVLMAIERAIELNVDVINLSIGGDYSALEAEAIEEALEAGIVVVAAAGNYSPEDGEENPGVLYPAALPGVIAVGATDEGDKAASFSAYGDEVDLAAPGVDVLSTLPILQDSYGYASGTSMAAPFVSAAAALVRTVRPEAGPEEVAQLLESTAVDVGPAGRDVYTGAGRLDLEALAEELVSETPAPTPEPAVHMAPDSLLRINFNMPVKVGPDTPGCFQLVDSSGKAVPMQVYFLGDAAQGSQPGYVSFLLEPSAPLVPGQRYRLTIAAGLTAINGSVLKEPYTVTVLVQ